MIFGAIFKASFKAILAFIPDSQSFSGNIL